MLRSVVNESGSGGGDEGRAPPRKAEDFRTAAAVSPWDLQKKNEVDEFGRRCAVPSYSILFRYTRIHPLNHAPHPSYESENGIPGMIVFCPPIRASRLRHPLHLRRAL